MSSALPSSEAAHALPSPPPAAGPVPAAAYASLAVAALIWSGNAILVKFLLREIPELAAPSLRITLAAATLGIVYAARGGRFQFQRAEWLSFLPVGFWGLGLSFFFFTVGLAHTSVSHAVFVGSLTPLAILFFSWRKGQERILPLHLGALVVSLAGVALLATDQQGGASPGWGGDMLLLAGVGCLTYYTVRSKELARDYPSLQFNTYSFLAAALWHFPLLVFELTRLPWAEIGWFSWVCLLLSGTLGSCGAYLAYYHALRWLRASQAGVIHFLHPPLGTALGVLFFREILTARFLLGAGLILIGVALAERRGIGEWLAVSGE
jgi:drug/metabolite transporter (DMT)-like permease